MCCLSTSRSSTDKLAFDVGLQEDTTGEYPVLSWDLIQSEAGWTWPDTHEVAVFVVKTQNAFLFDNFDRVRECILFLLVDFL